MASSRDAPEGKDLHIPLPSINPKSNSSPHKISSRVWNFWEWAMSSVPDALFLLNCLKALLILSVIPRKTKRPYTQPKQMCSFAYHTVTLFKSYAVIMMSPLTNSAQNLYSCGQALGFSALIEVEFILSPLPKHSFASNQTIFAFTSFKLFAIQRRPSRIKGLKCSTPRLGPLVLKYDASIG